MTEFEKFLIGEGYTNIRVLEDGSYCALYRLMFTWAVFCDIGEITAYRYRWCFEDKAEALYFLENMKDYDEVPIKRESLKGHRYVDKPLLVEMDKYGIPRW